jgi:hypothetical protein
MVHHAACWSFCQIRSRDCLKRSDLEGMPSRCLRSRVVSRPNMMPAPIAKTAQATRVQSELPNTLLPSVLPGFRRLGRKSPRHAQSQKVLVLGHQQERLLSGPFPDRGVAGTVKADKAYVGGPWVTRRRGR